MWHLGHRHRRLVHHKPKLGSLGSLGSWWYYGDAPGIWPNGYSILHWFWLENGPVTQRSKPPFLRIRRFRVIWPSNTGTRGCGVPSRWCCAGSWAIGWTRLKELEPKRCWSPDPWHKGELRTGLGDRWEAVLDVFCWSRLTYYHLEILKWRAIIMVRWLTQVLELFLVFVKKLKPAQR